MKKFTFALILFLELCLMHNYVDACFATSRHHIHILSELPPDSPPVKVHCASGDDDLGDHILAPKQSFEWSFCANFFPTTVFFCHFWWDGKDLAFEVYHERFAQKRTHNSWWITKHDGIYFSNANEPLNQMKKYDWNNY